MFSFLHKVHKALDDNSSSEIVAFYSDFSKAFDNEPHFELLCKIAKVGVRGCILEVLFNFLTNMKQFVRVRNVCWQMKDVCSSVPQGSLLGPLLFCIFINGMFCISYLTKVIIFSETYLFRDDLKVLSINRTPAQIQRDLHSIENWVSSNKLLFALDKCAKVRGAFRGDDHSFNFFIVVLNSEKKLEI